jgi:hypothetical protein
MPFEFLSFPTLPPLPHLKMTFINLPSENSHRKTKAFNRYLVTIPKKP